jgi:excisionase family DNA binding protein
MDEEITVSQAAKRTGHSDRTIRRWIQTGKLHARQIPSKGYAILTSDLDQALGLDTTRKTKTVLMQARINELEKRVELLEKAFAGLSFQHIRILELYVASKEHTIPVSARND